MSRCRRSSPIAGSRVPERRSDPRRRSGRGVEETALAAACAFRGLISLHIGVAFVSTLNEVANCA
jgi:hypothetical protein